MDDVCWDNKIATKDGPGDCLLCEYDDYYISCQLIAGVGMLSY